MAVREPTSLIRVEADSNGKVNVIVEQHAMKPVALTVELSDLLPARDIHGALLNDAVDFAWIRRGLQFVVAQHLS